jgi:hypothetical protein
MHSTEAAALDRKSGEAEGSAVPGSAEFYPKQNCHLDRSVAKWRDLRFYPESEV